MPLDCVVVPAVAASLDLARETRIQIIATDFAEAFRLLEERRADLAVGEITELPSAGEFEVIPLRRHAVLTWVRPGHPLLALGRPAREADLLRHPLCLGTRIAGRYAALMGRAPGAASSFHPMMGTTAHLNLALAAQSDACTLAPAGTARLFHETGRLVPLDYETAWPAANFGIVWLKRRRLDAVARRIVERMQAADEAAFLYSQSLPAALRAGQAEGYAVAGSRHAPAAPDAPPGP
ncbi:substrate-binding domain-containing protein [Roseococcus sp. SDR]|nr:substrate-binding domain-containing protein [Roseococcus sp. SDR]MBV1848205.1 substrate-binding domain-containing protein [Roseococcus sp. SDR]